MKFSKNLWRESASIIILAPNANQKGHNFDVLSFKRPEKASFMAKSRVFPGGVVEIDDQSKQWLKYYRRFGYSDKKLSEISNISGKRPPIFLSCEDNLKKEISLRITAIRETFEELGILICRKRDQVENTDCLAHFIEDFDREKWQKLVHNNPKEFMELCEHLEVVPDVWGLHEWAVWLTPSIVSKRFETAFFLVGLQYKPHLIIEKNEVENATWQTPKDLIRQYKEKEIRLPPPQLYEISRLLRIQDFKEICNFAKDRGNAGIDLFLPIHYQCKDGLISVFPGDDLYPVEPNLKEIDYNVDQFATETMEEIRTNVKNIHRYEMTSFSDMQLYLNFKSHYGHLNPITENEITKSKL